jgi:hypothetical protein
VDALVLVASERPKVEDEPKMGDVVKLFARRMSFCGPLNFLGAGE